MVGQVAQYPTIVGVWLGWSPIRPRPHSWVAKPGCRGTSSKPTEGNESKNLRFTLVSSDHSHSNDKYVLSSLWTFAQCVEQILPPVPGGTWTNMMRMDWRCPGGCCNLQGKLGSRLFYIFRRRRFHTCLVKCVILLHSLYGGGVQTTGSGCFDPFPKDQRHVQCQLKRSV